MTRDSTNPSTSNDPNARWSRAVWRSIIAIARAWPVAPSSAERMTCARNGSDRIASIVQAGSDAGDHRQGEHDVRAEHQGHVAVVRPSRPILADIVEMPARLSSRMSRHSLPWRIAATSRPTGIERTSAVSDHSPLTAKYDAFDHERAHQQEHDAARRGRGSCTRAAAPCSHSRR